MYNSNIPTDRKLPSTKKLVRSTILAAFSAFVLLITVVMPAEYGIDPTGFGKATGLQAMGEIKMSLAQEAEAERIAAEQATLPAQEVTLAQLPKPMPAEPFAPLDQIAPAAEAAEPAPYRDTMEVTLKPNEGAEIKVDMKKGQTTNYVWSTDGGKANFDVHADSKPLNIDYHNYSKGSEQRKEGEITAAFDGSHGWFWRNRTKETLTVTLQTNGEYTTIKRVK